MILSQIQPASESGIVTILLATTITQVILQLAQMFFDNKKSTTAEELAYLRAEVARANDKNEKLENKIEVMQSELFEVKKSAAYYQGRVEALEILETQQEDKVNALLNKQKD